MKNRRPIPTGAYAEEILPPFIQRMSLRPGDIIIVTIPTMTGSAVEHITKTCKRFFPGHKVIVKPSSMSLKIVRKVAK